MSSAHSLPLLQPRESVSTSLTQCHPLHNAGEHPSQRGLCTWSQAVVFLSADCVLLPPCFSPGQPLHQEHPAQLTPSSSLFLTWSNTQCCQFFLPLLMERSCVTNYLLQGQTPSSWQCLFIAEEISQAAWLACFRKTQPCSLPADTVRPRRQRAPLCLITRQALPWTGNKRAPAVLDISLAVVIILYVIC